MFSHQTRPELAVYQWPQMQRLICEKMKNKANFNIGKIGVSSLLTSEYENTWAFLFFFAAKNKANLDSFSVSNFIQWICCSRFSKSSIGWPITFVRLPSFFRQIHRRFLWLHRLLLYFYISWSRYVARFVRILIAWDKPSWNRVPLIRYYHTIEQSQGRLWLYGAFWRDFQWSAELNLPYEAYEHQIGKNHILN